MRNALAYFLLSLFTFITILVILGITQPLDDFILPYLAVSEYLVLPISLLSDFFGTYVWFIICLPLFLSKKIENIITAGFILLNILFGFLFKLIFSIVIPRTRPPNYTPFLLDGNSYPSGHTMRSFACSTVLGIRLRKPFYLLYVIAIITGLTRLMIEVHYFSDVVSGAIFGIALGILINNFFIDLISKKINETNIVQNKISNIFKNFFLLQNIDGKKNFNLKKLKMKLSNKTLFLNYYNKV